MKNYFLLAIILFAFACGSIKPIPFSRTGAVECVAKDRTTITLQSRSVAHTAELATEYAIRNAFENLLFKGIPNSNQERALIPDESSFLTNHSKLYNRLMKQKEYQLFIIDSISESNTKQKDGYQSQVSLKVDLHALRAFLEKNGAIRKFGI